ncbi:hypothetical protein [Nocardia sp. NPDC051832]|uniref:hypothetical protein n=1 Tax=Nocardia sp. NPDC051832 TaxID=3155673 RepID=UPI003416D2F0
MREMAARVQRGDITRSVRIGGTSRTPRRPSPAPERSTTLSEAGYLHIGEGERAAVTLTNRWFVDDHEKPSRKRLYAHFWRAPARRKLAGARH